jgi:hypothetical protein
MLGIALSAINTIGSAAKNLFSGKSKKLKQENAKLNAELKTAASTKKAEEKTGGTGFLNTSIMGFPLKTILIVAGIGWLAWKFVIPMFRKKKTSSGRSRILARARAAKARKRM